MRYWIEHEGTVRGPMRAEEIALLPGAGLSSRLCPESRDLRDGGNWQRATAFPDLERAFSLAADAAAGVSAAFGGQAKGAAGARPSGSLLPWAAAAALAIGAALWPARKIVLAPAPPAPRPAPVVTGARAVEQFVLPGRHATLRAAAGGAMPTSTRDFQGRWIVSWGTGGPKDVVVEYDESKRQLRPLTEPAARLFDIRRQ